MGSLVRGTIALFSDRVLLSIRIHLRYNVLMVHRVCHAIGLKSNNEIIIH